MNGFRPTGIAHTRRLVTRLLPPLHAAWCVACLTTLALLIGARWFRYSGWPVGPGIDRALHAVMVFESQTFLWPWAYARFEATKIALAVGVLVLGLHRRLPAALVHAVDGVWHLRRAVMALACGALVSIHYLFDVNPAVTRVCFASLILVAVTARSRGATGLPLQLGLWGVALAYWLVGMDDVVDRMTVATWVAFLLATQRYLVGRIGSAELALLRVAAVVPANLLSALLPLLVPLHGGTHLGNGLAYSFCERPEGQRLYAAIPVCDSIWSDYAHCRDGAVAEYDLATMTRLATHRFFTPSYYGRLEMLLCLDDEVLATVHGAVDHGQPLKEAVLAFPYATPGAFDPLYATGVGATIAYDATHDAVFYSAEFDARIVRYDRRTKRTDESTSPELRHAFVEPITLAASTGSHSLDTRSVHPGRNRIYVTEVMQGGNTYALDLTTLNVVARYDGGGGGAFGVAVDPERDRLFVSSLWGLEIFDLKTDRLIARKRTGLGNRPVIVDAARNRLYLSSMVEGKIRVLDRDTFAVIGQIPIGIGSRFPHLSRDEKRFFASSVAAHYYWDADTMVPRP